VTHVDQFVDELLREDRVCDVILPRLMARKTLEDMGVLEPRVSPLEEFLSDASISDSEEESEDLEAVCELFLLSFFFPFWFLFNLYSIGKKS
jgi:pre-mRNA-splicing factor 38A